MGKSILIVEDEQNIVDILSFNLSREGYDTLEAYDGPTGLQLALEQDVYKRQVHYGGPMYYIEKGLGMKWLAVLFSLVAGFACFGIGNISQSSEIAGAMEGLFGMSGLTTGVLLAVVVGIVVLGGVQRIGRVTSYMVPFMAIFYIGAGLAVILLRIDQVPAALASIFTSAFSFEAVGGGVFGYAIMVAMRQGFARGVFSNEAGPVSYTHLDVYKRQT